MNLVAQRTEYFETIDKHQDGVEVIVDPRLNIVQITQGSDTFQMTLYEARKMAEFINPRN